jgi:hypothetical protein
MSGSCDSPDEEQASAVVDRVTDGVATLLVGEGERSVVIPASDLPAGVGEGAWVLVREREDGIDVVGIDAERTAARRAELEERLGRVRRSRGSGRFPARGRDGERPA